MKKFKFSLENLLELRAKRLEEKQIEFGKLQFVMKKLENELLEMQEEIFSSQKNLDKIISTSNIDINLILNNQNYISRKETDIKKQNDLIKEHQIKLNEKKSEMIEALKEKTMLEKLKEKQYKTFLKEIETAERKELDEIGLVKYTR